MKQKMGDESHPYTKAKSESKLRSLFKNAFNSGKTSQSAPPEHQRTTCKQDAEVPQSAPKRLFMQQCVAALRVTALIAGLPIESSLESMQTDISEKKAVEKCCECLADLIKALKGADGAKVPEAVKGSLESLHKELVTLKKISPEHAPQDVLNRVEKRLSELDAATKGILQQFLAILPCARAAYNDYTPENQRRVSCFKGTREALLKEIVEEWVADSESRIHVLSGLAGIGKSTIAQTVAERFGADDIRLLGASFFFSRDEAERKTAEKFFTTIAFQLCVHNPDFAAAIGSVLMTERGKDAVTKVPVEQLERLILEPLQRLTPRRVVIVVDALDECADTDGPVILQCLNRLVQCLPLFKVVLTTRPQPHLRFLLDSQASQKFLHLHNIEERIVNGDIELYLRHNLAWNQVRDRLPALTNPWAASDEDIQSLVHAAGGLFVIAATALLYILDKTSTPAHRMKILRIALDQDRTPFNALNRFYTIILRNAVPEGCERDTANHYQMVVGTIILIQQPLSITALARLINIEVDNIAAVLGNLQPVILLGSNNIPLIYHKSLPDYIQDPARCKVEDLRIDTLSHNTRMAVNCFRTMNQGLRGNIFELDDPARFMGNKNCGLIEDQIREKIPCELLYACTYWGVHVEGVDMEDQNLADELGTFVNEHLLHWFEILSWIGKLDTAHHSLLIIQKQLVSSSELGQLVTDGLRFIGKFYDLIKHSALHTYHSALPFTPTETSLYKRYSKLLTFCQVHGGQNKWDALITTQHVGVSVSPIIFSANSRMFALGNEHMHIYDAIAGIPVGSIKGRVSGIANDFSKAAVAEDSLITLYNIKGVTPIATIKPPGTVDRLVLSPDGFRLVAGLDDGTLVLWDTKKCEQIETIWGWEKEGRIVFSPDGRRIAFASRNGIVKLLDGTSDRNHRIVADLSFVGLGKLKVIFSGDGSRLACLEVYSALRVWNSIDGTLIGTAKDAGYLLAISMDGSLLATGGGYKLKLWSGKSLSVLKTLDLDFRIWSLAISQNGLLGIGLDRFIAIYDTNSHKFIAWVPFSTAGTTTLAFSPDCLRLATGGRYDVHLWDIPTIIASYATSQRQSGHPIRLAFSSNCSRLASGHEDGTIKLWATSDSIHLIAIHSGYSKPATALAFSIDGEDYASGWQDGVIQLWNGSDNVASGALQCPGELTAVALSSSTLAAATDVLITLWDLRTKTVITTLDQLYTRLLTLSHCHQLLVVATHDSKSEVISPDGLSLWDLGNHIMTATLCLGYSGVKNVVFTPDCSRLAVHCRDDLRLFNVHDNVVSKSQDLSRLGVCPCWHGIPVWLDWWGKVTGLFSEQETSLPVLYKPSELKVKVSTIGSSMIALGCEDGNILLIKAV